MQLHVLGLVDDSHTAAAQLLDDAVVRDDSVDHGWRRNSGAMLGVLRSRVNEDDRPMDAGNGKSRDFRLSQALANQVVQKGVCGDFILCGLSPPVSPRQEMVSQYTFWNVITTSHNMSWGTGRV